MERADIVLARDVLDGKIMVGQNVLLVGGGSVGSELADYIATPYRDVTLIEMRDEMALDEEPIPRMFLLERLAKHGINMITGASVKEFINTGVVYTKDDVDNTLDGFDTVVLSMGTKAYNPLESALKEQNREVYVVGDALEARRAMQATQEAFDVAVKI